MRFFQPGTLPDAFAIRAEHPDALPLAGGTDVMVDVNAGRCRPAALLDLGRVPELADWHTDGDTIRLGAAVPYARIEAELAGRLPGLAAAARTVGSPQIRARGTVGGNLGTASPAGDAAPPLLAAAATVEVGSVRGNRLVPVADFFTGPRRHILEPDELVVAVRVPAAAGPQQFAKVGSRSAMVIAICSFALALHPDRGEVGTGLGSAAPTPRRAPEAERFLAAELAGRWESRGALDPATAARFGELVAAAAEPIDDLRGTAGYRRHGLAVLARRTLAWAWADYQGPDRPTSDRQASDHQGR